MKPKGNTILITGGSSGIGAALAHRLHNLGNIVIIAGRRLSALQSVAAGRGDIVPVELDITDPHAIAEFAGRAVADYRHLNVLINNAGVMYREPLDKRRDLSAAETMIATNLLGPIRLTSALIEHLARQPGAAIVNTSSGVAFVPLVLAPTYSASKAALHSYTVSLREVLKGKVEVIELLPPPVQTSLTPGQETREGYQPVGEFADEAVARLTSHPAPLEVLSERVRFLRLAEAEGRFEQALTQLNGPR